MSAKKTFRMKKEMLENWLKALRSGKYKQCSYVLERNNAYCCLGVLQKVVDGKVETVGPGCPLALPTSHWFSKNGITNITRTACSNILTNKEGPTGRRVASSLNDDLGLTFPEIADILESSCETY